MFGWSQKDKNRALIKAVREYEIDAVAVRKALAKGAQPDTLDNYGRSALSVVVHSSHCPGMADALDALLQAGADINARDASRGMTPLLWAAESRNIYALRRLITEGADIHAENENGENVLHLALQNSHHQILKCLIEEYSFLDQLNDAQLVTALGHAMPYEQPSLEFIKLLYGRMNDPNAVSLQGDHIIHSIVHADYACELLDVFGSRKEFDVNRPRQHDGITALYHAVTHEDCELACKLIALGAVPGTPVRGTDLLCVASYRGQTRMMEILMEGAEKNKGPRFNFEQALLSAVQNDNARGVKMMIDAGASVDAVDDCGRTSLMLAASRSNLAVVKMLLAAGADEKLRDDGYNRTAYDYANSSEIRKYFTDRLKPTEPKKMDEPFSKLSDYELECKQGSGLSMVFNFFTQQLIYRDAKTKAVLSVTNFDDVQRQEAIAEAFDKLVEKGGKPPAVRSFEKTVAKGL